MSKPFYTWRDERRMGDGADSTDHDTYLDAERAARRMITNDEARRPVEVWQRDPPAILAQVSIGADGQINVDLSFVGCRYA